MGSLELARCSLVNFGVRDDSSVRHLDVVGNLLLEAALDHSRVETTEEDFFTVALEPHLLLASLFTQMMELDPVLIALRIESCTLDGLQRLLLLPANHSASTPLL